MYYKDGKMYTYWAKCTKVIDGDTLELEVDLGFRIETTIRMRCTWDTPELFHASSDDERERARQAKELVESLVLGEKLKIKTIKLDGFGRWGCTIQEIEGLPEEPKIKLRLSEAGLLKQPGDKWYKGT